MKPATALPWHIGGGYIGSACFVSAESGDVGRTEGKSHETDAHYIVHACNAYPRLVEALRRTRDICYRQTLPITSEVHDIADALLKELGE